jgi:flagellar protein FlaG
MNINPTGSPGAPPVATPASPQPKSNEAITRAIAEAQAGKSQAAVRAKEPPAQSVKASAEASRQELEEATKRVQQFLEAKTSSLKFSIDEQSGVRIVRVIDNETKDVIRQIPSEEMVAIARALESLQGLLVRQKA